MTFVIFNYTDEKINIVKLDFLGLKIELFRGGWVFLSLFSSVRSSYSHPDLLLTHQQHPLFFFFFLEGVMWEAAALCFSN